MASKDVLEFSPSASEALHAGSVVTFGPGLVEATTFPSNSRLRKLIANWLPDFPTSGLSDYIAPILWQKEIHSK